MHCSLHHFDIILYSVDTRESNFSHGTHWSDETYRERLTFTLEGRTGILSMRNTRQDDTGEYRCRVDFQKSPTRNSKVNLTVISKYKLFKDFYLVVVDSRGLVWRSVQNITNITRMGMSFPLPPSPSPTKSIRS